MFSSTIFLPTSRRDDVMRCLDALDDAQVPAYVHVVLMNKDICNAEELTRRHPTMSISAWVQTKPGLVQAANESLAKTTTEFFIRLDDDTSVTKDWYHALMQPFVDPTVYATTGPTLVDKRQTHARDILSLTQTTGEQSPLQRFITQYIYEGNMHSVGKYFKSGAYALGANSINATHIPHPISVDNVEACNFAVRTNFLKAIGGFDMSLNRGLGEYHEADIARAIISAGHHVVFHPNAIVHHHIHRSNKTRPDSFYRISNFIRFYRRYFPLQSLDQALRFFAYTILQLGYYFYKFLGSGDWTQLGAFGGVVHGGVSGKKRIENFKL